MRRSTWLALIVAVSGVLVFAAEPDPKAHLAGTYRCEGTSADGTAYHGIVEIAAQNETFLVRWSLSDGIDVVGVGVYSGGVLAVSYFGGAPAIAVYKVDQDRLVGEWTIGLDGAVHAETLTKTTAADAPRKPRRVPARGGGPGLEL